LRQKGQIADPMRFMRDFEILATSKEFVATAARFGTAMLRPTHGQPGSVVAIRKIPIGIVQDLDLAGDRLLLLL
jgi:hypothetical protein